MCCFGRNSRHIAGSLCRYQKMLVWVLSPLRMLCFCVFWISGPCGSLNWAQRENICDCHAFFGRLGVCKLTLFRLRSAGIADRKVPWLPCAGSIILRRARGEYRGGRRRDVGTAFLCCEVRLQPRGRRPLSWAGPQLFAMWELSLGVVLGACSAGGCF